MCALAKLGNLTPDIRGVRPDDTEGHFRSYDVILLCNLNRYLCQSSWPTSGYSLQLIEGAFLVTDVSLISHNILV